MSYPLEDPNLTASRPPPPASQEQYGTTMLGQTTFGSVQSGSQFMPISGTLPPQSGGPPPTAPRPLMPPTAGRPLSPPGSYSASGMIEGPQVLGGGIRSQRSVSPQQMMAPQDGGGRLRTGVVDYMGGLQTMPPQA